MGEPVAKMRSNEAGNVVITFADRFEVEFTPDQCDDFARQLLRRAHPREHLFVLPLEAS